MDRFKIIVQNSPSCVDLLKYVDKNIEEIYDLNAEVRVEKISSVDDKMLDKLKTIGINNLPALIAPDGTPIVGIKKIVDMFNDNLRDLRDHNRIANKYGGPATDSEFGSNPDLTDFWQRELFAGFDRRGRMKPRKDADEDEMNDAGDIERKMSDYQRNVPRHRRAGGERDVRQRGRGRRDFDDDDEEMDHDDNIYDSDEDESFEEEPQPRGRRRGGRGGGNRPVVGRSGDAAGDEMDRQMMAAWMDNNED